MSALKQAEQVAGAAFLRQAALDPDLSTELRLAALTGMLRWDPTEAKRVSLRLASVPELPMGITKWIGQTLAALYQAGAVSRVVELRWLTGPVQNELMHLGVIRMGPRGRGSIEAEQPGE